MAIMKSACALPLALAPVALFAVAFAQGVSVGSGATLTTSLAPGTVLWPGQVVEFTVEATSARPDRVTLNLLDPPPGCVFTQDPRSGPPKSGGVSSSTGNVVTATGKVRWMVPSNVGGLRRLTFRATDHTNPGRTTFASVDVRVEGESAAATIVVGDVTGDGVLDTVAGARLATVAGMAQAGAVYVWKGVAAPSGSPDATLVVPGAVAYDQLGKAWKGQGTQLADVTGDGVLDVVVGTYSADVAGVSQVGAIYVWKGGATLTGTPAPLATLTVPGAVAYDSLGQRSGQGIQLADVTGDGMIDVVSGSIAVTVGGVAAAGALYVWKGGPTLSGSPAPLATLTVPGAVAYDYLGMSVTQLVDVTSDGILDVVAGSLYADVGGVTDVGAVYVWKGGPLLQGTPALLATLTVPGASAYDGLSYVGDATDPAYGVAAGQVGRIADVTGDGVPDLVVGAINATVGSVAAAGAVYVWQGGPSLTGMPAPLATLTIPGPIAGDYLGLLGDANGLSGQGIQLVDVTGDGLPDVVAGTSKVDVGGVTDAGAIYVWQGGATLTGTPAPLATLTVPGAVAYDRLGDALGQGLLIADMTGDGVVDLVAGARRADVAGVVDAGAIYVWSGGASLVGTPSPLATLTVPGATAYDQLGSTIVIGFAKHGLSIQLADITGDGTLDVVAGTIWADVVAGKTDGGAVYVWAGGPALSGSLGPLVTLYAQNGNTNDLLGSSADYAQGVQLADVTGDGILDVIVEAINFDVGGVQDAGMVFVWAGGSTLNGSPLPLAELRASNRVTFDQLGYATGQSILLADVTGDGVPDVVASARFKNVNGKADVGGIYVWAGGAALSGTLDPLAALTDPGAAKKDYLGSAMNQGYYLADITGDGVLDVVAGTPWANVSGIVDVGALYLWEGGYPLVGSPALLSKLTVPGAKQSDLLTH